MRAILFDLGETLVRYEGVPLSWQAHYPEALAALAQACGQTLEEQTLALGTALLTRANTRIHPRTQERPFAEILAPLWRAWGVDETVRLRAEDAFYFVFQQRRVAYEDAARTLAGLRAAGLRLGVLTDVPYGQPSRLVAQDLVAVTPWLDAWLTSVEVGFRKPDPRGMWRLCERLGIAPGEAWYVGNEGKDIAAARAAGLFAVLLDRDGALPGYDEDWRIGSLEELLPAVTEGMPPR